MKQPRVQIGQGTLGRSNTVKPVVTLSLRDNGYGPGVSTYSDEVSSWSCMRPGEARRLATRLLKAADRAEGRYGR